jgi:GTPase SAR1 family protein
MSQVSVAVIGDSGAGKTCLVNTLAIGSYPMMTYMMTKTYEDHEYDLEMEGEKVKILL